MRRIIPFSNRRAGLTVIEGLIVLLLLVIIAIIAAPNFQDTHSPVSRVRTDHRFLATAIEAYWVDHKSYPTMRPFASNPDYDTRKFRKSGATGLSFIEPGGAGPGGGGLTTPVAYVTSLFPDPFAPVKGMPFAYFVPKSGAGWMLISPGSDGIYNLTPEVLETVYNPAMHQPSALLLAGSGPRGAFTYDPTNGTVSPGDIWRVKQ